jgi:hypothetical protein
MSRWIIVSSRGGSVLIAIGLALLLVSLIPSAQLPPDSSKTAIPPTWVQPTRDYILTPQQGLRATISANGSLDVYILEVSSHVLYEWVDDAREFLNVTDLDEFLEANPGSVGWHGEVHNGTITHEYVPTKVTNATLVLSNPSSVYVPVEVEVAITNLVAPAMKVRTLAQWAIPIGFVLAIPWLARWWKERTRQSP